MTQICRLAIPRFSKTFPLAVYWLAAVTLAQGAFVSELAAQSSDTNVGIELGLGQTDNLGRTPPPEIRSNIGLLGLDFLMSAERPRLQGALVGNLQHRHYGTDQISDDRELVGSIDGSLSYHIVEDLFVWTVQQNYGQSRTNPVAPVGPGNRDRTTVSSTGPVLSFQTSDRNRINFSGLVSERAFNGVAELDSRLTSAQLGLSHALSTVAELSFSLTGWQTDYENTAVAYDYQSFSFAYTKELASGSVEALLGSAEIDIGVAAESSTIGTFAWTLDIGARSNISLFASRDYTDSGQQFGRGGVPNTIFVSLANLPGLPGASVGTFADPSVTNNQRLDSITLTTNPALRSTTGTRLALNGLRTTISFSAEVSRNRFEVDNSLDSDTRSFLISLARNFGGRWRTNILLSMRAEEFVAIDAVNRDRIMSLSLTRLLVNNSEFSISMRREERTGGIGEYEADEYIVSVSHQFGE